MPEKITTEHRSAAVIVERRGRVLLLQRGPTDPWMPMRWDLPGGKVEAGETPAQGAAREALEEAAIRVSRLVPLVSERPVPASSTSSTRRAGPATSNFWTASTSTTHGYRGPRHRAGT